MKLHYTGGARELPSTPHIAKYYGGQLILFVNYSFRWEKSISH
jgi:hypothetical protein